MATRICANPKCNIEFEPKRKDALYHSDACRKAVARKEGVDPETGEILVKKSQDTTKPPEEEPYDYEANLKAFQKMGLQKVEWITTGIPQLDEFQMIPRGRITQIQGPYAAGKTTLALNMIKGLRDKKVLYIDSEASLNPELLAKLKLEAKNFHLWNESAFIEDIYDQVLLATKSGEYDMVILDSLAACTTQNEGERKSTDRNIGEKALIVNKMMRIVPMRCKDSDTALVIINQEREVIGSYVPQKYTPGGMGPVYAASLILGMKTIPSWRFPKDAKNGQYKGHEIEITILKSKVSQPHRKTRIKLYYVSDDLVKETAPMAEGEF